MKRGALKETIKKNRKLYALYLFLFRNEVFRDKRSEAVFYKKLNLNGLVFDIGANVGSKTILFTDLGLQVISLEPDDENFEILTGKFATAADVILLKLAVSNKVGETTFFIDHPGSAFNTLSGKWKNILQHSEENRWGTSMNFITEKKVATITLEELLRIYGCPDYIKIDVEGHEWECIEGLSTPIRLISFEANLPEFKTETLKCIDHLKKIDQDILFNCTADEFNFHLPENLNADKFSEFISGTNLRYMDVFSFMTKTV